MSTNEAYNQVSSVPESAYKLGIDGESAVHYHDPLSQRVFVEIGDSIASYDLEIPITTWIARTRERCGEWEERELVEKPGGAGELLQHVAGQAAGGSQ